MNEGAALIYGLDAVEAAMSNRAAPVFCKDCTHCDSTLGENFEAIWKCLAPAVKKPGVVNFQSGVAHSPPTYCVFINKDGDCEHFESKEIAAQPSVAQQDMA